MALPRFFSRVRDSILPVANLTPQSLEDRLGQVTIGIQGRSSDDQADAAGPLLAVNLASRLYPSIALRGGQDFIDAATRLATSINPGIDINTSGSDQAAHHGLRFDPSGPDHFVEVASAGWNVSLDGGQLPDQLAHPLADLASAALGMSEVFREVFATELGERRGRGAAQPATLNLLTLGDATETPTGNLVVQLSDTHLVGAGAIGQACVHALMTAHATGRLVVVDPEDITLTNLQRYVLTTDTDVGRSKVNLVRDAAAGSGLAIDSVRSRWGDDARTGPGATQVATAVDNANDRLEVAAALPRRVYNAWTQPADLGWSRHEEFGVAPCLGCLYYPQGRRPNEHELIAAALHQHPLRTLAYLVRNIPVGLALPALVEIADQTLPIDASLWLQRSIVDDLLAQGHITDDERTKWAGLTLGQLYRDGVCAGGLLNLGPQDTEAVVPLAHQSALAGIMLAVQLVAAADPQLRGYRNDAIEARIDLLSPLPQHLARPRQRTPGCLCSDPAYLATARWQPTDS